MAIREIPAEYRKRNRVVRIAEKIKASKFSCGPEYKFVFKIESTTSHSWRAFFAESMPTESRPLLEEVRQARKARYTPVYFHRTELDIVCIPSELNSILEIVKSVIPLANDRDAIYHAQLTEEKAKKERAWKLAQEAEDTAEKKIQNFFAKLKL